MIEVTETASGIADANGDTDIAFARSRAGFMLIARSLVISGPQRQNAYQHVLRSGHELGLMAGSQGMGGGFPVHDNQTLEVQLEGMTPGDVTKCYLLADQYNPRTEQVPKPTIFWVPALTNVNVSVSGISLAGNNTPDDAYSNPSDALNVVGLGMVWDSANGVWQRVKGRAPSDAIPNPANANSPGVVDFGMLWNGSAWERRRTPNVFQRGISNSLGDTAVWTPAPGTRFRLMGYEIQIDLAAATAVAGIYGFSLIDGPSPAPIKFGLGTYIPAVSTNAMGIVSTGWIELGNGYLSTTVDNPLNINLPVALTKGSVIVLTAGTEE